MKWIKILLLTVGSVGIMVIGGCGDGDSPTGPNGTVIEKKLVGSWIAEEGEVIFRFRDDGFFVREVITIEDTVKDTVISPGIWEVNGDTLLSITFITEFTFSISGDTLLCFDDITTVDEKPAVGLTVINDNECYYSDSPSSILTGTIWKERSPIASGPAASPKMLMLEGSEGLVFNADGTYRYEEDIDEIEQGWWEKDGDKLTIKYPGVTRFSVTDTTLFLDLRCEDQIFQEEGCLPWSGELTRQN